ncbi:hypothetical protein R5R35_001151 [Gryllus longicercus]|uniref:TIR domain-containing protein n=1 Tax=Gryllus longicercus TaxID=2509291 RepID=A0AAN9VPZ7_9ORTH
MGTHIVANIADAIDQSRKVIVVLSSHFIQSQWCQWELELAQHKLFSEDRACLVLLELEPLERGRLPRLLRFLLDTRPVVRWPRPETAAAVAAAAQQLRRALGPSLRPPQQRPSVEHLGDNEDRCEGRGGAFALPSLLPPARRTSDEHLGQHDGQGGAFTAAQSPEEFELREAKGSSVAELPV